MGLGKVENATAMAQKAIAGAALQPQGSRVRVQVEASLVGLVEEETGNP